MSRASGFPDTPQRNRDDISDLLRAMSVEVRWKDLQLNDCEKEAGQVW